MVCDLVKKIIYFILFIGLILPINVFAIEFPINSSHAVLYNLNEDTILYEKDKDSEVSIASLTKIMTCIVALEHINNLDEKVVLTNSDFKGLAEANAAVAGFRVGEEVTYRDLIYGLMLPSGADAAQALTRLIAGNEEAYIKLMNDKAVELGLQNTHFVNPTGLDDDNHYSTVSDVSKLFKYAIKNEEFLKVISTDKYTTSNGRITLRSTISKSLSNYNISMDYIIGGKTGTTYDAGLCLATIAEANGVKYMLITTGVPMNMGGANFNDQKMIYDYFINNFSYKEIVSRGDLLVKLPTEYAKDDYVIIKASKGIEKYLNNDFLKEKIELKYNGIDTVKYDMKKNDKLGSINIIYEGNTLESIDILLNKNQELDIFKYLMGHIYIVIGVGIFLTLVVTLIIFGRKKRH